MKYFVHYFMFKEYHGVRNFWLGRAFCEDSRHFLSRWSYAKISSSIRIYEWHTILLRI